MLIEPVNQAERAVKDMLTVANRGTAASANFSLGQQVCALCGESVESDTAASADFRLGLQRSKGTASKLSTLQTAAASCTAATEHHGDGGAQIHPDTPTRRHADTAGPTLSDTRGRVKTGSQAGRPALGLFL